MARKSSTLLLVALTWVSVNVAHAPPLEPPEFCGPDNWPALGVCQAYRNAQGHIDNAIETVEEQCAETPGECDPGATSGFVRDWIDEQCAEIPGQCDPLGTRDFLENQIEEACSEAPGQCDSDEIILALTGCSRSTWINIALGRDDLSSCATLAPFEHDLVGVFGRQIVGTSTGCELTIPGGDYEIDETGLASGSLFGFHDFQWSWWYHRSCADLIAGGPARDEYNAGETSWGFTPHGGQPASLGPAPFRWTCGQSEVHDGFTPPHPYGFQARLQSGGCNPDPYTDDIPLGAGSGNFVASFFVLPLEVDSDSATFLLVGGWEQR